MLKLKLILTQSNSSFSEEEAVELIEYLQQQSGYISPNKVADALGFKLDDVTKFMVALCSNNFLEQYIAPKYKEKIQTDLAVKGFAVTDNIHFQKKEDGYAEEYIRDTEYQKVVIYKKLSKAA